MPIPRLKNGYSECNSRYGVMNRFSLHINVTTIIKYFHYLIISRRKANLAIQNFDIYFYYKFVTVFITNNVAKFCLPTDYSFICCLCEKCIYNAYTLTIHS